MDFEKIMREIAGGLAGKTRKDIRYLAEQAEKYKDHEMRKEILRAIGLLAYHCMPEDRQAEMNRVADNDFTSWEPVLGEVIVRQQEKKTWEALVLMEALVWKLEDADLFAGGQDSEYHCFSEFFEEVLYRFHEKPSGELRRVGFPLDVFYSQYGSLLMDAGRPEDAEAALEKALRWNPADAGIMLERAEARKTLGDPDGFFRLTADAVRYAFRPGRVARCFKNLGLYFAEKKMPEEALGCYTMSMQYESSTDLVMNEWEAVQRMAGDVVMPPGLDRFREIGRQYGFPAGADPDVVGLSYGYGKKFAEEGNTAMARYCWEITCGLVDDGDLRKQLDGLPPEKEGAGK